MLSTRCRGSKYCIASAHLSPPVGRELAAVLCVQSNTAGTITVSLRLIHFGQALLPHFNALASTVGAYAAASASATAPGSGLLPPSLAPAAMSSTPTAPPDTGPLPSGRTSSGSDNGGGTHAFAASVAPADSVPFICSSMLTPPPAATGEGAAVTSTPRTESDVLPTRRLQPQEAPFKSTVSPLAPCPPLQPVGLDYELRCFLHV